MLMLPGNDSSARSANTRMCAFYALRQKWVRQTPVHVPFCRRSSPADSLLGFAAPSTLSSAVFFALSLTACSSLMELGIHVRLDVVRGSMSCEATNPT